MTAERPPCIFVKRLGGLFPANNEATLALAGVDGKCVVRITAATRNQRRRSLYWIVVGIVAPILNDAHGGDWTDAELHAHVLERLGYVTESKPFPDGSTVKRLQSTSDKAMNEADRTIFTNKAFDAFSRWTGVPVDVLIAEGRTQEAA